MHLKHHLKDVKIKLAAGGLNERRKFNCLLKEYRRLKGGMEAGPDHPSKKLKLSNNKNPSMASLASMDALRIVNSTGFAVPTKLLTSSRTLTSEEIKEQDRPAKLAMLTKNPFLLSKMSIKDRADPDFVLTAMLKNDTGYSMLLYANELLRDDLEFVKKMCRATQNRSGNFSHISYRLRNEEEVVNLAVEMNNIRLEEIPAKFRTATWVTKHIVKEGRFFKEIMANDSWVRPGWGSGDMEKVEQIRLNDADVKKLYQIALKNDPTQIAFLPQRLVTPEMVKNAVGLYISVYRNLPSKYQEKRDILLEALKAPMINGRNGRGQSPLKFAPDAFKRDSEVAVAALKQIWYSYKHIDQDTYQSDDSLVILALEGYERDVANGMFISSTSHPLLRASERQRRDKGIVEMAIRANGNSLNLLMEREDLKIYTREEMLKLVDVAVSNNPIAITAFTKLQLVKLYPTPRQRRDLVLKVCKEPMRRYYLYILQEESFKEFRNDTTVVQAALKQNPLNLQFLTEEFKTEHIDMVRKALYQNFELINNEVSGFRKFPNIEMALEYAPEELKNNKALATKAVQVYPLHYEHISDRLRVDRDILLTLFRYHVYGGGVGRYYNLIERALKRYKDDRDVVLESGTLEFASRRLKKDEPFVLKMMYVHKDGKILLHAHKSLRSDYRMMREALSYGGLIKADHVKIEKKIAIEDEESSEESDEESSDESDDSDDESDGGDTGEF